MAATTVEELARREYKYGFITDIEADTMPPGLNEDVIRLISAKKNEPPFMLEWRLKAYRHWAKLEKSEAEPKWANIHYPPIDYQKIIYYSAPKTKADRIGMKQYASLMGDASDLFHRLHGADLVVGSHE